MNSTLCKPLKSIFASIIKSPRKVREWTKTIDWQDALLTWTLCLLFWCVSWFDKSYCLYNTYCAISYGLSFVISLIMLLRGTLQLIQRVYKVDDNEVIVCLTRRDSSLRLLLESCEPQVEQLKNAVSPEREVTFQRIVAETLTDVRAKVRCMHRLHVPTAMYLIFLRLVFVGLTFASVNIALDDSHVKKDQIMEVRDTMPTTLPEKILLYTNVSLDHMSLGNLRMFAMSWPRELVLVSEVFTGLWIVLVLAPMVFVEASTFQNRLAEPGLLERELINHWSTKFAISK